MKSISNARYPNYFTGSHKIKNMKTRITCLLLAASLGGLHAQNLLSLPDPAFETMPEAGMAVHKSPEAEESLTVRVIDEGAHEGMGCLEIALPAKAYASVSFPLDKDFATGAVAFAFRGELAEGAEVKIGVQSYTMAGGFQSVDFKPMLTAEQITESWQIHRQAIERAEGATHWQISVAITGPATIWIDALEAEAQ